MADPQEQGTQAPQGVQWQDILTLGNQGINTFRSSLKIGPNYLADGENIEIDDQDLSNRGGSIEVYKDSNNIPTTAITQLITAEDSHGVQYLTRYWNGNFEFWDTVNSQWIKLNGTVTFSSSKFSTKFGKVNWNNGYGNAWNEGADVLYLGNGLDQLTKWVIAQSQLSSPLNNGDTIVHLNSTVQFPPLYDAWHTALSTQPLLIAGTQVAYNAVPLEQITITTNPSNNDTLTFTVNGTEITITFVTSIGSNPGNVLIGVNPAATLVNLLGLFNAPGTTNSSQVALSSGNQTLVGYLAYVSVGTSIYASQASTSFTSVSGFFSDTNATTSSPNALILSSGWSGTTIATGSTVVMPLQKVFDISNGGNVPIPGGNIMLVVNQQIYMAGISGSETFIRWSDTVTASGIPHNDPEYWDVNVNFIEVADGDGPITAMIDNLDNVIVHKRNAIRKFYFQEDSTLDASLPVIAAVYTGDSAGSISNPHTIAVNLSMYYPTATEGISVMTPSYTTSGSVVYTPSIVSIPIQDIVTDDVTFDVGEGVYYGNKAMWSVRYNNSQVPNLVLYYDIIAQGWGKETGWYVNSFTVYNDQLLFADHGSFGIKQGFSDNFDDNGQPYTSFALSSQMSFGEVAKTKQNEAVYVQGTINQGGKLYVDVYYNSISGIWTKTYLIDSTENTNIIFPFVKMLGESPFGTKPFIGGSETSTGQGFFRFYLKNNLQWMWNTAQIKIYSKDIGTQWTMQAVSMCPVVTEAENSDIFLYSI